MFVDKNVKDIMIPIENYSLTSIEKSLKEAIIDMRKVYCEVETGKCTEAGHRTSLVMNEYGHLVGIIDFSTILRALIPDIAGRFTEKMAVLNLSIVFAEADTHNLADVKSGFKERVLKNAEVKIGDIMLKLRGSLKVDDNLLEALKEMYRNKVTVLPVYEGSKVVGVLRDSDLFLATARILTD
jgi:CBS domain-containing protein